MCTVQTLVRNTGPQILCVVQIIIDDPTATPLIVSRHQVPFVALGHAHCDLRSKVMAQFYSLCLEFGPDYKNVQRVLSEFRGVAVDHGTEAGLSRVEIFCMFCTADLQMIKLGCIRIC